MALTPLRLERFSDPTKADQLRRLQDNVDACTRPVFAAAIVDGKLLTGVELAVGSNVVDHTLGRALQGWIVVGIDAAATIYDTQAGNASPALTLLLTSSAVCTVNLWVF